MFQGLTDVYKSSECNITIIVCVLLVISLLLDCLPLKLVVEVCSSRNVWVDEEEPCLEVEADDEKIVTVSSPCNSVQSKNMRNPRADDQHHGLG